jgi:hypothetical protein
MQKYTLTVTRKPEKEPNMRRTMIRILPLFLLTTSLSVYGKDEGDNKSVVREAMKKATSTVTSSVKNTVSGIADGLEEGRKEGGSVDNAVIVNDRAGLTASLEVKALSLEERKEKADGKKSAYVVTVALKNDLDVPVRLTNLFERGVVLLIDADGFATNSPGSPDVTVPAKAAIKTSFDFNDVEGKPASIRLHEQDFKLP